VPAAFSNGNDPCKQPQAALKARNGVLLEEWLNTGASAPIRARQAPGAAVQLGAIRLPGPPAADGAL